MGELSKLLTICRQCGAVLTGDTRKKHKAWHKKQRREFRTPGPEGPQGPPGPMGMSAWVGPGVEDAVTKSYVEKQL